MGRRILGIVLAVVVAFTSIDMSVFASEAGNEFVEAGNEFMEAGEGTAEADTVVASLIDSAEEAGDSGEVAKEDAEAGALEEDEEAAVGEAVDEGSELAGTAEIVEEDEEAAAGEDVDEASGMAEAADAAEEGIEEEVSGEEIAEEEFAEEIAEEERSIEVEGEFAGDANTLKSTAALNTEVENKIRSFKNLYPEGYLFNYKYDGAEQCFGFAKLISDKVFGSHPEYIRNSANGTVSRGWTCYYVTEGNRNTLSVEPGDIIDAAKQHTAMVLSVSSDGTIKCVQCNWSKSKDENGNWIPDNHVYWDRYFNYNENKSTLAKIWNVYNAGGTICLWKPSDTLKKNAKAYSAPSGESKLTISISDSQYPPTLAQGQRWPCKGTITSQYSITQVGGYILQYDNGIEKKPPVYSVVQHPNTISYSLDYSAIDAGLLFDKLEPGTYYYKITAHDSSGKAISVEREFMVKGQSNIKISGETYPPSTFTEGTSWSGKGTITSNYRLTQIGCYINQYLNPNDPDEETRIRDKVVHPEKTMSYSIDNSDVKNALQFNTLEPGTYYYTVTAHDASGATKYMIKKWRFEVVAAAPPESTLSISGATYPTTIEQGSSYTCKGVISSNYNITVANFYIFQLVDGVQKNIYHKMVEPNAKSYSLENNDIKNALLFNNLPAGNYYYQITAEDASGKWLNLLNRQFTVIPPPSTLKIEGATYPYEMNQGTDFTCKGVISSNYNITVANFYIFQLVDGVQKNIYHKMVEPKVRSYSIDNSEIKNALLFKNLPAGNYYYQITAEDSSGKWLNLLNMPFTVILLCNFSGELTKPASGEVYEASVEIEAKAADSYEIKNFNIKLSGAAEKTMAVAAGRSGNSYVCDYTLELPMDGSYEVTVDALCSNGAVHRVGSRTLKYVSDGPHILGAKDKIYTGSAIKQEVELYFNGMRLREGVDYSLTYKNNVNVCTFSEKDYADFEARLKETGKRVQCASFNPNKAPQAIIKMKGNYSGKHIVYYQIKPADISGEKVNVDNMTVTYSGRKQTPTPTLIWKGSKLKYGMDFGIPEYEAIKGDKSAFTQPGSYNLTIVGRKNFSGKIPVTLTISSGNKQISINKAVVKGVKASVWTGERITPSSFSVSYKKDVMSTEAGDFTVAYGENNAVGKGSIILTGTGEDADGDGYSYIGTKTISFKITGIPISRVTVSGVNKSYAYTGEDIKPAAVLTYKADKNSEAVTLTEGVNYTVEYQKNRDKGTAAVIFKGIESGGCTGVKKKTFKITASELDGVKADAGQIEVTFKDSANVVEGVYVAAYMKGGVKPEVIVTSGGKTLKLGEDYTLSYANNTKAALFTDKKPPAITVNGRGNYSGSRRIYFSILPKNLTNENGIRVAINDKVESARMNGYRQSFKVYDADGRALSLSDYDSKNAVYTLVQTKNEDGSLAKTNEVLDEKSIVPAESVIQVTVQGKGNYAGGIATGTYRIIAKNRDIGKAVIQINKQTYTGGAVEITGQSQFKAGKVFIKSGKETQVLTLGKDIEVVPGSYVNNVNKGTAKVTFRGIGAYGGTKTVSFKIGMCSIWEIFKDGLAAGA